MTTELRASFAERDQYLNELAAFYAEGRLDHDEFTKRRDDLLQAVTHQQMQALFADLPARGSRPRSVARVASAVSSREADRRLNRRGLLLAGAGVAVVAVGGIVVATNTLDNTGPIEAHGAEDETFSEPSVDSPVVMLEQLPLVLDDLRSAELTWLGSLRITDTTITGTAHADGDSTHRSEFERLPMLTVIRPAKAVKDSPSFAIDALQVDSLSFMVQRAMEVFDPQTNGDGLITQYDFVPDGRGGATITLTCARGHIVFNSDGSRVLDVVKNR